MIGLIVMFLIGCFAMTVLLGKKDPATGARVQMLLSGSKKTIRWVLIVLVLILIASQSIVVIEAGTVGVVKRLGAVAGEMPPGLHFLLPGIEKAVLLPTLKKTYEASDNPQESKADYPDIIISALTSDGQQIRVGITARFMIMPGKAAWIVQNLGTEEEYVEKVVKTEIRGSGRRVPTKFAAYDLYTKRSYEAQQAMFDEIAPKFEANGLILDEVVLRNINFTPEYARTLEEKQIALENISTEKNKLEQEKIRKEQKIVAAEGDAKSIEIRQLALTKNPTIIQWEFVQKLAPNIQWGVLPQNVVPMLNMQNMMGTQK